MAGLWVRSLKSGNVRTLVQRSGLPFVAGTTVAARTRPELEALLESMTVEAQGLKGGRVEVMTAAQLRKRFGSVPAGVQEGAGKLYAVVRVGGDTMVLILAKAFERWRVVGVTR